MRDACGQIVKSLGTGRRITSVWVSTMRSWLHSNSVKWGVKPAFIPALSPVFSPPISPRQNSILPLIEHYLYPVSTAPTNNYNQGKLKKGNK